MPFNHRRLSSTRPRNTRSIMNAHTTTARSNQLPKSIRDELRMSCALRGYSLIRCGDGKTRKQQHELMSQFYHGVPNVSPSQIRMLSQAINPYNDLYDTTSHRPVTSRKSPSRHKAPTTRTYLKEELSRDDSRLYYLGADISFSDLEKKIVQVTLLSMDAS